MAPSPVHPNIRHNVSSACCNCFAFILPSPNNINETLVDAKDEFHKIENPSVWWNRIELVTYTDPGKVDEYFQEMIKQGHISLQDGKVIYHAQAESFKTSEEKVQALLKKGSYTIEQIANKLKMSKGAVDTALTELRLKRETDQPSRLHEFTLQSKSELVGLAKSEKQLQSMFKDQD
ncbi:MAG: hypothetical protein HWN65_23090 [Candidatus Helarchaeota archaeon]|nr:hypothetical protein [Candidatus Helarchaeota archaeon]